MDGDERKDTGCAAEESVFYESDCANGKGEEYRLPQKDVRAIVDLIDSGEYEYRE